MSDSTKRFSDRVDNYVRYRPSYPGELLRCLEENAGLSRKSVVADVGSGTGIFTALVLPLAARVYAVEPNDPMRAAAEQSLAGRPGFVSVAATAEATTLPSASVDLITSAQAFHWFKPAPTRLEFARVLRPSGQVALIWNERLSSSSPFSVAYENLLRTQALDYDQTVHTRIDAKVIAEFFSVRGHREFSFPNAQEFDWAGLAGRVLSSSYVPNVGHPRHTAFMDELRKVFEAHAANGRVSFDYQTRLYLGAVA